MTSPLAALTPDARGRAQRLALATVGLALGLGGSLGFVHSRSADRPALAPERVVTRVKEATRSTASSSLPQPVLAALARRRVVVLSFVMPGSELDTTASGEARAAARSSAASFFAIDASSAAAASLLRRYQLKSTPAVVVLAPPNRLMFRASMFLDAASVRQAILDVRR